MKAVHALLLIAGYTITLLGCASRNSDSKATDHSEASSPEKKRSEKAAIEITEFTPPITIVRPAGGFLDGGTIYVQLRDSKKRSMGFCVSQDGFESTIPPFTLFVNAFLPEDLGARLPLSTAEAELIVSSLQDAIDRLTPDEKLPDNDWGNQFARGVLRHLKSLEEIPYLDAARKHVPKWYGQYENEQKNRRDFEDKERQEEELFMSFYPAEARRFFSPDSIEATEANADGETVERLQGRAIANQVKDPVKLAEISFRALGTLTRSWSFTHPHDRVAMRAATTVSHKDFEAALPRVRKDRQALLGAARMGFREGYLSKLPPDSRADWTIKLAEVVLLDGDADDKSDVLFSLGAQKDAKIRGFLRNIAQGKFAKDVELRVLVGQEPGLRTSAYLCLARQGDASIKAEVQEALKTATEPADIATLEICLALLGDGGYLKRDHFRIESNTIGLAALQAIEQFHGHPGMDILVEGALEHPWAHVKNEAVLSAERITGQQFVPPDSPAQERSYADDVKAWWNLNKEKFEKKN